MDETAITRIVEALILPPGGLVILGILGLVLARGLTERVGRGLLVLTLLLLYLSSIPVTASLMARGLQYYPALTPAELAAEQAGAIVVLAAGQRRFAPEYGGSTLSAFSLERARFAARVHRETGLPVVASGGWVLDDGQPEAAHLAALLDTDFGVSTIWTEPGSLTTRENARESARVLAEHSVTSIILVTHADHMPRAVRAFRSEGLEITAAPTGHYAETVPLLSLSSWLPSAEAAGALRSALRERLGSAWYRYTGGSTS